MATTLTQLRYSPFSNPTSSFRNRYVSDSLLPCPFSSSSISPSPLNLSSFSLLPKINASSKPNLDTGGNGGNDDGAGKGGPVGGGGGGGGGDGESEDRSSSSSILGIFLAGWRSRVSADPQFPFKVLMEELVGVSACLLGDMATRPNFGLDELDFVFSTLVVGSIMNFVLMYLLAPTMASSASATTLPSIFASCPTSHMFEPGAYGVLDRFGTFVYKGVVFAGVGFAAGLVGTAISNGLIKLRKKLDPSFETPNKAPPTMLNALTWATHMGLSSNLRYQTLNGVEFLLAKGVPPLVFKSSVIVLRCLNNVLGGVSFVTLARFTGSQKVQEKAVEVSGSNEEKVKLVDGEGEHQSSSQSDCK